MTYRSLFFLIELFVLNFSSQSAQSASAPMSGVASSPTICNWGGAQDFEIGFITCGTGGSYDIRVYDALTGILVSETLGVNENTNVVGMYDWVAHFDEGVEPPRVDLNSNTLYKISFGGASTYLYYDCRSSRPGYVAGSFTCPFSGGTSTPDVIFSRDELGMRVAPIDIPGHDGIDSFFNGDWIFPHYLDEICNQITCGPNMEEQFPMFIAPGGDTDYTLPIGVSMTVPSDRSWTWTDSELSSLEFQSLTQLIVEGDLSIGEGVTLTAADADQGWSGIWYLPDSGGNLRGVTIEKFGYGPPGPGFRPHICGVTVNDRWLAVHRSFIQDGINGAHGVCSSGDEAQVALWDENAISTEVINNTGHGLLASNQGRFLVRNGRVDGNGINGGTSMGIGSVIYAYNGSTFSDNGGVGLASLYDGNVILYDPNGSSILGTNTLDGNEGGGLLAQDQGSYINAGTFNGAGILGTCVGACENRILNHDDIGIPFDAKATSGALIFAEFDFWGDDRDDRSDLNLIEQGSGMIEVDPIWDGTSLREGPVAMKSEGEPSAFRETARGLIIKAFENAAQGRWIPAFAHAQAAVALATGEDEISMAMGAVSALLGHPGAPDMPIGLQIAIEAHLGIGQQGRPYALRSLLSSHRTHDRDSDARAMALSLIADYPRTEHGLTGLAQEVELALEADDLPGAQTALATMEADFPDAFLTETTHAYFVLIAGADALPARVAPTPVAASAAISDDSGGTEAGGFLLHSAYPNPFNPQTIVPFSVTDGARVKIAVIDLLGRAVATLVDGRYEAGVYQTTFDGSRLASGMYLLKATVQLEADGASQTFTQRLTLLK